MNHEQSPNQHAITTSSNGKRQHLYEQGIIEDVSFAYDGFQVVRGEYFAHIYEPSMTFSDNRITVNKACLNRAPDTDYVQILVNPAEQKIAIRLSTEGEKASFLWRSNSLKERNPKQVKCPIFFAMIIQLMTWNPCYRYKLLGKFIRSGDDRLFVFDLNEPEIYQRLLRDPETGEVIKPASRIPMYPAEWKNQFGLPMEKNKQSLQINIYNGYAVYGITEPKTLAALAEETSLTAGAERSAEL